MAKAPKAKKAAPKATAKIICTCDRLPLESGETLVRDQSAEVPTAHAVNYEAAGRARRV